MSSLAPSRSWLRSAPRPLTQTYDVALLDLDGVVYLGAQPIAGAADALAAARAAGMRVAFVTNNSSRTPETVAAHLAELGVPATADDVVTSAQAAVRCVLDHVGGKAHVLVVGGDGLRAEVERAGLTLVEGASQHPDAVVQGYSPHIRYADLAEATLAVRAGAYWVATNTDSTLPSPRGLLPGNGSLVAAVRTATGADPVNAGKPAQPLHDEALRRTGARRPLVVGDRLDTDIEGANAAGSDSLLVLTGVCRPADLVVAPPAHRPTYLARDLGGLLTSQPPAHGDGATGECGSWRATAVDGSVELAGEGEVMDGLRAVLALVWSLADGADGAAAGSGPAGIPEAKAALARLGME